MDLLNVCRLCLAEKLEMYDVFSEAAESYTFADAVQEIARIRIEADDQLSKNICSSCREACTQFISFRDTIVSSNDYQLRAFSAEQEQQANSFLEEIADEDLPDDKESFGLQGDDNEEYLEEFQNEGNNDAIDLVTSASSDDSKDGIRCTKCSKTFTDLSTYDEHLKGHMSKARLFPCRTCKRKFTSENMRTCHEIVHSDLISEIRRETANRCLVCNQISATKADLEDHIRDHKAAMENGPISCIYCPKQFTKLNNLTRHLKTHEENKTHKCNQCEKTFAMGQELIDHLGRHKGTRKYTCFVCDNTFQLHSALKAHMEDDHGGYVNKGHEYLCTECGKSFSRGSNLRQHLLRHRGEKPFPCPQCPARFVSKGNLKAHMTSHTGQKPFTCNICGSSFTQSYSLVKHNRIHTNERPYQCEYCDMRFFSSDHLKRHVRTHTGEKPYKCEFCEKSFSQNGDLNKHKRLHVGENTYKCTEHGCTEAFRLQADLRNHQKVHYCKEDTIEEACE